MAAWGTRRLGIRGLGLGSLAVPRGLRSVSHGSVADSLNCAEWSLLPPATEEMVEQAELLKGRFQGDPSFEYEYAEVNAEDDENFLDEGKEVNTAKRFPALFAAVVSLAPNRLLLICHEQLVGDRNGLIPLVRNWHLCPS